MPVCLFVCLFCEIFIEGFKLLQWLAPLSKQALSHTYYIYLDFEDDILQKYKINNYTENKIHKINMVNIRHIAKFLDQDTKHHVIRCLILSCMDYGNALLYGYKSKDLDRLQALQNKAVKLIFNAGKREHTTLAAHRGAHQI